MGLVVHPARAMASPIEGMNKAHKYATATSMKVHRKFSFWLNLRLPLNIRSSIVSLEGRMRSGIAA